MLRPGLLAGRDVLVAGTSPLAAAVAERAAALGAAVRGPLPLELDEDAAEAALAGATGALVVDAGAPGADPPRAADGSPPSLDALRAALDGTWIAVRAVANAALIPGGGGPVVLLAPRPGAGPYAEGTRAGIENLARVASIEWARHAVRPLAVLPGAATTDAEVAGLTAYLVSDAAAFATGCAFRLGEAVA